MVHPRGVLCRIPLDPRLSGRKSRPLRRHPGRQDQKTQGSPPDHHDLQKAFRWNNSIHTEYQCPVFRFWSHRGQLPGRKLQLHEFWVGKRFQVRYQGRNGCCPAYRVYRSPQLRQHPPELHPQNRFFRRRSLHQSVAGGNQGGL